MDIYQPEGGDSAFVNSNTQSLIIAGGIMKHAVLWQDPRGARQAQAASACKIVLCLFPLTVLVSACGGDDLSSQLTPILQVGMQRQYAGTATRTVVYANPTAGLQNNTLEYTFVENQSVQQAPASAPADFDLQTEYTYTVVQDPGVGSVPISEAVDNYEDLLTSGATQTVTSLGQKVVTISNDETSNALGNGPYTATTTTTSTYPAPRDNFPYPLQTGATMTVSQSETQTIAFTDVNANGSPPSNGTDVGYTLTRTENDDGSLSYQTAYLNGNSFSRTLSSDGSGSQSFKSATSSTDTTVGLPAANNGVSTIPIAVTVDSTKTTTTNYSATDWYPGGGAPISPLVLETRTVVGPTATLPAECSGAVLRPGIDEIDTTTTSLNPMGPTFTKTTTRNFSAGDGASVCQLSTETESSYDLDTGALVSTTTTTTATLLKMINYY